MEDMKCSVASDEEVGVLNGNIYHFCINVCVFFFFLFSYCC